MALLLAKGEDLAVWRGVDEFVFSFQERAIHLASSRYSESITAMLEMLDDQLAGVLKNNHDFIERRDNFISSLSCECSQSELSRLINDYYSVCYDHFRQFASPFAFFGSANRFMQQVSAAICETIRRFSADVLPPVSLLILGPAGRMECTRFCRIQLALIHGPAENPEQQKALDEFSLELVAWFRSCGIPLDETVTPVHAQWRGTVGQWHERIELAVQRSDHDQLVELLRLLDQFLVYDGCGVGEGFRENTIAWLGQRLSVGNLMLRCTALSNGLGLMGGLKLEKGGPHRGKFALLDHALIPLSATVAALSLMSGSTAADTPARLKALVKLRRLDVDLAERGVQAWHLFSSYRLQLELDASVGQDCRDILNLAPERLSSAEMDELRLALETVGDLQRTLQIAYGGYRQ